MNNSNIREKLQTKLAEAEVQLMPITTPPVILPVTDDSKEPRLPNAGIKVLDLNPSEAQRDPYVPKNVGESLAQFSNASLSTLPRYLDYLRRDTQNNLVARVHSIMPGGILGTKLKDISPLGFFKDPYGDHITLRVDRTRAMKDIVNDLINEKHASIKVAEKYDIPFTGGNQYTYESGNGISGITNAFSRAWDSAKQGLTEAKDAIVDNTSDAWKNITSPNIFGNIHEKTLLEHNPSVAELDAKVQDIGKGINLYGSKALSDLKPGNITDSFYHAKPAEAAKIINDAATGKALINSDNFAKNVGGTITVGGNTYDANVSTTLEPKGILDTAKGGFSKALESLKAQDWQALADNPYATGTAGAALGGLLGGAISDKGNTGTGAALGAAAGGLIGAGVPMMTEMFKGGSVEEIAPMLTQNYLNKCAKDDDSIGAAALGSSLGTTALVAAPIGAAVYKAKDAVTGDTLGAIGSGLGAAGIYAAPAIGGMGGAYLADRAAKAMDMGSTGRVVMDTLGGGLGTAAGLALPVALAKLSSIAPNLTEAMYGYSEQEKVAQFENTPPKNIAEAKQQRAQRVLGYHKQVQDKVKQMNGGQTPHSFSGHTGGLANGNKPSVSSINGKPVQSQNNNSGNNTAFTTDTGKKVSQSEYDRLNAEYMRRHPQNAPTKQASVYEKLASINPIMFKGAAQDNTISLSQYTNKSKLDQKPNREIKPKGNPFSFKPSKESEEGFRKSMQNTGKKFTLHTQDKALEHNKSIDNKMNGNKTQTVQELKKDRNKQQQKSTFNQDKFSLNRADHNRNQASEMITRNTNIREGIKEVASTFKNGLPSGSSDKRLNHDSHNAHVVNSQQITNKANAPKASGLAGRGAQATKSMHMNQEKVKDAIGKTKAVEFEGMD